MPFLYDALFQSDLIYQIKINDIYHHGGSDYIVTSTIIDTIKGKVVPNCKRVIMPDSIFNLDSLPETEAAVPGTCYAFELRDDSQKFGNPPYDEFISFSSLPPICVDTANNFEYFYYYTYETSFLDDHYYIFPVYDGKVLDSNNVMGFGINLNVDVWKQKLREKINEIKNSQLPSYIFENVYSYNQFSISPNPSTNSINLSYPEKMYGEQIKIFNTMGIPVWSGIADSESKTIDISGLAAGAYFLRMGKETGIFIKE